MPEKFKNKYTIKSARLKGYDYSQNGMYFITICTKDRQEFFGKIKNKKIILSNIGKMADKYWKEIPKHFLFVNLDEYIIMPNHLHGILEICDASSCRDEALPRLYNGKHPKMSAISPKCGSLSIVIGSFKSIVSKMINKQYPDINFQWQSRFYDHIICNDESLNKIREYIQINPPMWEKDRNNLENLYA